MKFPSGFRYSAVWLTCLLAVITVVILRLYRDEVPGWLAVLERDVLRPVILLFAFGLFVGMVVDWFAQLLSSRSASKGAIGVRIGISSVWLLEMLHEFSGHDPDQGIVSVVFIIGLWLRPIYDGWWLYRVKPARAAFMRREGGD